MIKLYLAKKISKEQLNEFYQARGNGASKGLEVLSYASIVGLVKKGGVKFASIVMNLLKGKGISVIGPRATYVEFAKDIGANYLKLGKKEAWTWAKNEKFLKGIVKRGDDVIFAGKFNPRLLDKTSALAREINYLKSNGYKWVKGYSKLVKQ